jgi:hypothetical protein
MQLRIHRVHFIWAIERDDRNASVYFELERFEGHAQSGCAAKLDRAFIAGVSILQQARWAYLHHTFMAVKFCAIHIMIRCCYDAQRRLIA